MRKLIGPVQKIPIYRFQFGNPHQDAELDLVAVEEPLQIRLQWQADSTWQEKNLYVTMRTPGQDFDLAVGFLLAEGIIQGLADILSMRYCKRVKPEEEGNVVIVRLTGGLVPDLSATDRNFIANSSCGVCGKSSLEEVCSRIAPTLNLPVNFSVNAEVISGLTAFLNEEQTAFKYTGGLHAAVLFDQSGKGLLLREDVGRHNAMDKLIGAAFQEGYLPHPDRIVLLSGRISFELVQKAAMAGVPLLAALGAPSSLAVDLAYHKGIALIGFLKKQGFNCYSYPERIKGVGGKNH
ncbi:Formate dehydrogenase chain D [Lunatimonas lonarensis]|uniref:Sulfur carrier protein FdhD n=1 Tax=Lunatimonas lonarensis TaxID=1232681 RepID=R7ZW10_9BACT|nr:formate dehydrogenase accessory sulfurtransferase FdhD [Lunatimonas lonarensis]EON78335.1 Formate dehydrogenase chain D [Lunatimonas lonarensis]